MKQRDGSSYVPEHARRRVTMSVVGNTIQPTLWVGVVSTVSNSVQVQCIRLMNDLTMRYTDVLKLVSRKTPAGCANQSASWDSAAEKLNRKSLGDSDPGTRIQLII